MNIDRSSPTVQNTPAGKLTPAADAKPGPAAPPMPRMAADSLSVSLTSRAVARPEAMAAAAAKPATGFLGQTARFLSKTSTGEKVALGAVAVGAVAVAVSAALPFALMAGPVGAALFYGGIVLGAGGLGVPLGKLLFKD